MQLIMIAELPTSRIRLPAEHLAAALSWHFSPTHLHSTFGIDARRFRCPRPFSTNSQAEAARISLTNSTQILEVLTVECAVSTTLASAVFRWMLESARKERSEAGSNFPEPR